MRNPQKKPQVRRLTPERRGFCLHFGSIVFEALFPGFTLSAILPARLSAASGSRVLFLESLSSIGGVAGGGRDHLQTKALRWSLRSPFAFRGGRFFSPARRLKSYWPMWVRGWLALTKHPDFCTLRIDGELASQKKPTAFTQAAGQAGKASSRARGWDMTGCCQCCRCCCC